MPRKSKKQSKKGSSKRNTVTKKEKTSQSSTSVSSSPPKAAKLESSKSDEGPYRCAPRTGQYKSPVKRRSPRKPDAESDDDMFGQLFTPMEKKTHSPTKDEYERAYALAKEFMMMPSTSKGHRSHSTAMEEERAIKKLDEIEQQISDINIFKARKTPKPKLPKGPGYEDLSSSDSKSSSSEVRRRKRSSDNDTVSGGSDDTTAGSTISNDSDTDTDFGTHPPEGAGDAPGIGARHPETNYALQSIASGSVATGTSSGTGDLYTTQINASFKWVDEQNEESPAGDSVEAYLDKIGKEAEEESDDSNCES